MSSNAMPSRVPDLAVKVAGNSERSQSMQTFLGKFQSKLPKSKS